ncbi:MAG: CoA ester lyase [Candidatus Rokubacteria bacterium]|nr:CoA ester lyase [Candidatus Rokubacteria bacterium]
MRLRRSLLFVPGSAPERIARAIATAADGVILDLEDAVAPAEKARAREWVVAALRGVDFRGKERVVRVNPLGGPYGTDDLAAIVPAAPDALLLPKVTAAEEVTRTDEGLSRLEHEAGLEPGRVRLHLLVETVAGVLNAAALARASARTAALLLGAGDLIRETRGWLTPSRAAELYALSHVLFAARAAGLDALDSPYFDLANEAGLETHARLAVELGYDGKAVVHPKQIEVVNRLFTPSPEAVAHARRVLATYEEAEAAGAGALTLDGQFIDAVHVAMARTTLARAQLAGVA